jgi:hypothetical protein
MIYYKFNKLEKRILPVTLRPPNVKTPWIIFWIPQWTHQKTLGRTLLV